MGLHGMSLYTSVFFVWALNGKGLGVGSLLNYVRINEITML